MYRQHYGIVAWILIIGKVKGVKPILDTQSADRIVTPTRKSINQVIISLNYTNVNIGVAERDSLN